MGSQIGWKRPDASPLRPSFIVADCRWRHLPQAGDGVELPPRPPGRGAGASVPEYTPGLV